MSATLVEYQRGVLFRRGHPVRDVNPGRCRVWAGTEKVMIVDTRPVHLSYEHQSVLLCDGAAAVYSISGSARVLDVRKALYAASNYNQIPSYVALCCVRSVLNSCTGAQIMTNRDSVVDQIINRAKPRLANAGFELLSLRLPELSVPHLGTAE